MYIVISIKNSETQCVHCLNVPVLCFRVWPDDGSFEPKRVTEFLTLIAIYTEGAKKNVYTF